mgnify:CR=1 FL=1
MAIEDDDERTPLPGILDPDALQDAMIKLWPLRHAHEQLAEHRTMIAEAQTKIVELEAWFGGMSSFSSDAKRALNVVEQLRLTLIGEYGDGGAIGEMRRDHDREIAAVEGKATESARFVRRVMIAALTLVMSGIGAAGVTIYSAGESAASDRATIREIRLEHSLSIQRIEETMGLLRDDLRRIADR